MKDASTASDGGQHREASKFRGACLFFAADSRNKITAAIQLAWLSVNPERLLRRIVYLIQRTRVVAVADVRGADFYRQRADDMRRQADRALSRSLHEIYMRIARDWERMAEELQAEESRCGRRDEAPDA